MRIECYKLQCLVQTSASSMVVNNGIEHVPVTVFGPSHETLSQVVPPGPSTHTVRTLAGWPLGKSLSLSELVPS